MRVSIVVRSAVLVWTMLSSLPLPAAAFTAETGRTARVTSGGAAMAGLFNRTRTPEPQPLLSMPVAEGRLSSPYGMRLNPVLGAWMLHAGIDWSAPRGTPILAAGDGVVISVGWEGGYGYTTRILHADGVATAYAHQSRFAPGIELGAVVVQGQVIGQVGSTGNATGPHLHYEVTVNGATVDPLAPVVTAAAALPG